MKVHSGKYFCAYLDSFCQENLFVILFMETALLPAGDQYNLFYMQVFENVLVGFYVQNVFLIC